MIIDYTAQRTLKSGHTAGTAYQITANLSVNDRISGAEGAQMKSLAGINFTTIHREKIVYNLAVELITSSTTPDQDDMREFLDSVKYGETFQLDVTGSSIDFVLDSFTNPYVESRRLPNFFRYAFAARKL